MITYLRGDATRPQGSGPRIIAHICNTEGGWGAGFVVAISRRWKEPERAYRDWYSKKKCDYGCFTLGATQIVQVEPEMWVANMIAQEGYARFGKIPLRYEALEEALYKVGEAAYKLQASVHMPRIGCGLAGGNWSEVEPLVSGCLSGHNVFVYDL